MCIERARGPVKSKDINILTILSASPVEERNVDDFSIWDWVLILDGSYIDIYYYYYCYQGYDF